MVQPPRSPHAPYRVNISENGRYKDVAALVWHGDFATVDEARAACRAIVNQSLAELYHLGISAATLWDHYTLYGDDPWIVGPEPGVHFSAWDYARERVAALCGGRF